MKRTKQMLNLAAVIFASLILCSSAVDARGQTKAQERADSLRLQLEEVQTKQLALQERLQTLEEQLKPENIEKSLAGVGSTKPEDLRESKRRQLEVEKAGIEKQLNVLANSKTRLETGVAQAEADAYHQSAKGVVVSGNEPAVSESTTSADTTTQQRPRRNNKNKVRPRRVRT